MESTKVIALVTEPLMSLEKWDCGGQAVVTAWVGCCRAVGDKQGEDWSVCRVGVRSRKNCWPRKRIEWA